MTPDTFNEIAHQYDRLNTADTPIRQYSEAYTIRRHMAPLLDGKRALDAACSDGYFCRLMTGLGAREVVGVDLSPEMLRIARQDGIQSIDYVEADVVNLPDFDPFDIVLGSYVLNYARDVETLNRMCQRLFDGITPGGQFFCFVDHPDFDYRGDADFARYGLTKYRKGPAEDAEIINFQWHAQDHGQQVRQIHFDGVYFTRQALEKALAGAGFTGIRLHEPEVDPEGRAALGSAFWQRFLDGPPYVFLQAEKPHR